MQFVSASDNTDIDVLADANDDGILLAPTETQSFSNLKDVIDSAGDEITLEYNYKYNEGNPQTGINITKNLIINGNGAIIDGSNAAALFNISEGVTVTLKNLTIQNAGGVYHDWAAQTVTAFHAIYSEGTLNFVNCTFKDSNIDDWSNPDVNGSIYSTGDINIQNSKFIDNTIATCGVIYSTGTVTVNNSYFSGNKASSIAGAIYAGSISLIENSIFESNEGSAVYIYNENSVTSVKNSTFDSNRQGSYGFAERGAAIYTNGIIDLIEDSVFSLNWAKNGSAIYIGNENSVTKIDNSSFSENIGQENGGVIYTEGKIDTIKDSLFNNNMAPIGGVLYTKSVNMIDNSTFDNCGYYTDTSKGTIYITGSDDLIIINSTFDTCNAGEGGAIYTHGGVSLIDSEITGCLGDSYAILTKGSVYANGDVYIENTAITDNFAKEGSAVYTNSSITLKNCNDIENNGLYDNNYASNGGVFYAKGDVDIVNSIFAGNAAEGYGGAVYSEGNVNFINSSVNGSSPAFENGDGGFIYAKGDVTIENSTIASVYMRVADHGKLYSGAVYAEGDMTIRNVTFDNINKALHSYGGAIRVLGNVAIYNSNFTNNKAELYAAGYVNGTLDIYDCIFTNNTNGAIFSEGNAVVNNTMFINNTIGGSTMYGIAIGSNGTLNLTNSRATSSNAIGATYRGSVFSKDNLYVENCTFDEIHSEAGSATGMIISTKSNATIINTEFLDFSYHGSTIYGGSVYAGVNAYVENCTFRNATLIDQDGQTHGLCIYAEDNISLYNSTLKDIDSSNGQNGAVKGGNYVYVFNSTFTNITGARSSGGAIYANVANVTNSSFYRIICSDNADKGGAIYANDTYAYYNNFTDCHAGSGGAIYSLNYTTAIENIFINNSNQYSGGAIYTKNGFIQYNVILENMANEWNVPADIGITDSEVDSLEYNWWGENDPFGTTDKQKRAIIDVQSGQGTYFLPDTWVIMHFFVTNETQPIIGEGVNLTTTLKDYYNRTTDNESELGHNIAKRTVIYKVNNKTADENVGHFSHDTAPIINQDYVLYSNNNFLKHNVSSTIDYQTLYLDVAQCEINVTKTVTNATPNVGDKINYTITVSNIDLTDYTDPNRVIIQPPEKVSIELYDILDKRLRFVSANDTHYNPETGLWSFDLPWNKTVSLTIEVQVRGSGNITNYANITKINGTENKYGANVTIEVNKSDIVILEVNKTANESSVVVGDLVKFTITVNNTGTINATNVNITDELNDAFEFVSATQGGTNSSNLVTWTIDKLDVGQPVSVEVVVRVLKAGNFTNTAFANSTENKTKTNGTSDNVTVIPNVELVISKFANVTSAVVGDLIKYTITVKNDGLSDATGVSVWDVLPDAVRYVSGADSYDVDSRNASWTISSIVAGRSVEVYVIVNVTAAGNLSNTVFVNSSENDTVVNKTSDNVTVIPNVELNVTKSVDVISVKVGDKITYTITVANNGKSDATNVVIYDVLDPDFIYVSGGSYDANTRNVTWIIPTIAAGKSANRTVVVTAKSARNYTNVAFANSDENKTLVNGSSENVTVNPNVGLVVIKTSSASEVKVGENITFTITIVNNGESDATNVVISDILNNAFEWKSGGNYDARSRNVTWIIPNIPKHDSANVTVVVTALTAGNFTNVASVFSDENKTPVNDSTDNITVSPDVRLSMIKVADTDVVKVGENVTFTITVTNNGKSNATDVVISDIIPDAFEYVSGGVYDADLDTVIWTIDELAAGNSTSVTLTLTAKLAGNYSNVASVSSNENKTQINASSENITINSDVRLNMTKSADVTSVVVGNNVTFTIVVTNNGKSNATNVVISDVLNEAFLWKSGGSYDKSSRNVTWTIGNIAAGQSATVTLVATAMTAGNYTNVAFVNSDENRTKVNASSENVTIIPNVELNLTKEANASEVKVGDNITFTIVITNNGKSDASNVTVSDVLGSEFGYVSSTGGVYDNATRKVTWNIDKIEAGNSTKVTVVVTALTDGKFNNTVVAKSKENGTEVNASSDNVTIVPYVKLDIVKDSNASYVKVGEYIEFTITVTNNGKSNATNVRIEDKLEDAFGYNSSSEHSGRVGNLVYWEIANITAGESVKVSVVVNATKEGTYTNNATVISDENSTESNATKVIVIADVIILDVTKVANISEVKVGDNIKFTITISNIGTDDATDVVITDVLGEEFGYVESSNNGVYNNTTRKVTWTIPSIAARNSTEVYVIVTALTNGTFANTAVANAKENKTNVTGTSDNVTVGPDVKLNITKKANVTSAVVGDEITFTIVVANNGLSDATGVKVTDVLDKAFGYVSGGNYSLDTREVSWIIDSIAANGSETVTLVVKVLANGTFANTVVAVAKENDTEVTNSSDNVTVDPNVELDIVKKANVTSADVGDNILFTIVVSNNGLSDATDVKVTDVLDKAFEYVSGGSYDVRSRNVTWIINRVAANSSETVTLVVTVLSAGSVSNNVSVISKENDTEVTNSSDDIPVTPNVELVISKSANVTSAVVGDLIKYTITVKNDGLSDATDVNVWDILPETVRYVSGADNYDVDSRNASWTISSIAAGHSADVVLVVNVTGAGNLSNTAFANSSENDTVVNKTSDNVTVVPNVELDITKKANVTSAVVGDNIEYTIVVSNNGLSDATGVKVTDVLDKAFEYVSGGNYSLDTREVSWTINRVAANSSETVTLVVAVLSAGSVSNNVSVISKENDTEVTNSSDDIPVTPNVELSIVKVANVTSAVVGDSIKFTITIKNNGLSDATDVKVSDVLDEAFEHVSGGSYDVASRAVTWNVSSITANGSAEVFVIVKVLKDGTFANNVTANAKENDTEVTNSSDDIPVVPNVELNIVKVANVTQIKVGDEIRFNITVTNNGLSNASDVTVTDALGDEFSFVESDGSHNAGVVTWTIGNINANESATVYVIVKAQTNGTFANAVVANAKENETNVTGTSDNITVEPDVRLDIVKVANVTEVYVRDSIKFTITIKNSGLSDATNVEIEDILPESVKFSSANGTYVNDGQNVKWTLDKVKGNSSVSVYVIVSAVSNGPAVNFANVTCSQNSTANTTSDEIEVKPVVNLTVVKTTNASDIYVGDRVSYNIVVKNNGPSNASNVIVVDELPNGLKFVSSDVDCVEDNGKVTWNISKLTAGENLTIEVVCIAVVSGNLTNAVNVTCDENRTNITGGTPIHVSDIVDVAIDLSVDKRNPDINDEVIITLKVRNNGPSNATGIVGKLNKDFLNGLKIISINSTEIKFETSDLLGYSLTDILRVNENGDFSIDYLNANQEVSATIKATVIRDGNITVDGNVSSNEKDSNPKNNHDNITMEVHSLVNLSVNKTVSNSNPTVGDTIEYIIVVVNAGPSNATGVIVNEKLPNGVVYISDDAEGAYDHNSGVWKVDSINANETRTLTIKVQVTSVGQITNNVDVVSNEENTNVTGSKTNVTIDVQPAPKVDLQVIITSNTTKTDLGDLVEFTVTILNKGDTNATGVTVKDILPDGLLYSSDDGNGTYNPGNGVWTVGELDAGNNKVLHIIAKTTKAGNVTNTVSVESDQEILDVNSTVASVTVEVVEHKKPIENASDNIPAKMDTKATGNPLVLLAMALLFAGVGLRRRKE